MESYDEYAKRARLMAGVHGRTHDDGDKSEENASSAVKKKPLQRYGSSLESHNSLRDVNRSNKNNSNNNSNSNTMKVEAEKKSKKKSLKRL